MKRKVKLRNYHHIFCRSRRPELVNDPNNIVMVNAKSHDEFHRLFSNKLPEEILDYLVEYFWKGNIKFVEDYLFKKKGGKL